MISPTWLIRDSAVPEICISVRNLDLNLPPAQCSAPSTPGHPPKSIADPYQYRRLCSPSLVAIRQVSLSVGLPVRNIDLGESSPALNKG